MFATCAPNGLSAGRAPFQAGQQRCRAAMASPARLQRQQLGAAPPRRPPPPSRAAAAAAAAPAAVAAASAVLTPAVVFEAATLFVLPFYALMALAPRAQLTQRVLSGRGLLLAMAALYALLLLLWNPLPLLADVASGAAQSVAAAARAGAPAAAWRAAQPSMPAFAALFGRPDVTALAWVHLVLLDLVQARWVYQDARRSNVPVWHSAVLCFMVGPLGLLCHLATKALWGRRGGAAEDEYIIYRF